MSSRHCHNSHLCDNVVYLCQINADFEYRNADAALDVLPWLTQLSNTTSVCVQSHVVCVCVCECVSVCALGSKCEVGGQEKPRWKTTWRDKERQSEVREVRAAISTHLVVYFVLSQSAEGVCTTKSR